MTVCACLFIALATARVRAAGFHTRMCGATNTTQTIGSARRVSVMCVVFAVTEPVDPSDDLRVRTLFALMDEAEHTIH